MRNNKPNKLGVRVSLIDSGGNCYQAYVPARLGADRCIEQFACWAPAFSELDNAIDDTVAGYLSSRSPRHKNNSGRLNEDHQIEITLHRIIKINARILDQSQSHIRTGAGWVGAQDPASAWYVAPPPQHIKPLLKDLVAFINQSRLARTLRGAVSLLQFLLIHPFADGNGRTARKLFTEIISLYKIEVQALTNWIEMIWQGGGIGLHRCSLALREQGDWSEWLSYSISCYKVNRPGFRGG